MKKKPFDGDAQDAPEQRTGALATPRHQSQLDFEIEFFDRILARSPEYVDVLRVHASNLAAKGHYLQAMAADQRIVQLRPKDATAHYNLACSFALLKMNNDCIDALMSSLHLGYSDFEHLLSDPDLEGVRRDARFLRLVGGYLLNSSGVRRPRRLKP